MIVADEPANCPKCGWRMSVLTYWDRDGAERIVFDCAECGWTEEAEVE